MALVITWQNPFPAVQTDFETYRKIFWWARQDLNLGPMDYESTALTAELRARQT